MTAANSALNSWVALVSTGFNSATASPWASHRVASSPPSHRTGSVATTAALPIARDRDANLFPVDWDHVGRADQRVIHKTRTASDYLMKASGDSSSGGDGTKPAVSRSVARMKRHRTI